MHTHSSKPFRWCNGKSVEDSRSTLDPVRPKLWNWYAAISAKHTVFKSNIKSLLPLPQHNVFTWCLSSACWFSELALYNPNKNVCFIVQSMYYHQFIKSYLFSPWYSWKIVHLTLSNYQSRTHFLFYIAHFMVIHSYITCILILELRDTITEIYVVLQTVFQQHLHTKDISLRWCDIPNLVVTIMTSLTEDCCKQRRYWIKGSKQLN